MDRAQLFYSSMLIAVMLVLPACDPKFECDAHPETCPGLIVNITSSSIIKKLAPGKLDFTVSIQGDGKPEDPANVKAAIISTAGVPCRQALTTDPKPTAHLDLPMPAMMPDGTLAYSAQPTSQQLDSILLGQARLCVYGRDIGSADLYVMNKLVKLAKSSSLAIPLSTKFTPPTKPNSIGIASNKHIYLLFSSNGGGLTVRNMRAYTYGPVTETTTQYGINLDSSQIVFDPSLAAPNLMNIVVLRPNKFTAPDRFELYKCDRDMTSMAAPCTTDSSNGNKWNIMDELTALTADRNSGTLFVATKNANDLRGYDISTLATTDTLASKSLWTADKPTSTASDKTILALGDLVGLQPSKPDGKLEMIAVQSASHNVSIVIQPPTLAPSSTPPKLFRNSTLSDALQAKLIQALTPSGGGMVSGLSAVAAGDLDDDGLADIVIGFGRQLRVLFNMGDGTFRLAGEYPMNKGEESSLMPDNTTDPIVDIALGDIDNTKGNELVVLTGTTDATISVYSISTM